LLKDFYNPILSSTKDSDEIIRNSLKVESQQNLMISGPNMGGKTTLLRSIGIIYYLTMLGCAVPAESCSIHLVDSISVRIGADDDASHGVSTFMNEMIEIE